jgi:hypothetical protein
MLMKTLEHCVCLVPGNAASLIGNGQNDCAGIDAAGHADSALAMQHRILQQVAQDITQIVAVAAQGQ